MSNTNRWKPVLNEKYYYVNGSGGVLPTNWCNDEADRTLYKVGNCFRTREEAQEVAKTWKRLLNEYHANKNLNWSSSSELMKLSTDALKNIGGLSANSETAELPEWCKVGKWVYYPSVMGHGVYLKISEIKMGSVVAKEKDDCDPWYISYKRICEDVKPARLRQYNADEMRELVGKVLTCNSLSTPFSFLVVYAEGDGSYIESYRFKYNAEELKYHFTIDGKPCGKLVHKEGDDWVE